MAFLTGALGSLSSAAAGLGALGQLAGQRREQSPVEQVSALLNRPRWLEHLAELDKKFPPPSRWDVFNK